MLNENLFYISLFDNKLASIQFKVVIISQYFEDTVPWVLAFIVAVEIFALSLIAVSL